MGGSTKSGTWPTTSGGGQGGQAAGGAGPSGPVGDTAGGSGSMGGAGGAKGDGCPSEILATVHGPDRGLTPGMPLAVSLDRTLPVPRVILIDPVSRQTLGAIAGVPELSRLIDCLAADVPYRAVVVTVDGGRIDVRIVRQSE